MRNGCRSAGVLALMLAGMMLPAVAQENYPAAPVRLVVGFSAGGSADLVARLLAQKLSAQMNGSVIVENRDGASGNIGAELVARAKPEGYTALLNTNNQVLSLAFGEKLGYDLFRELTPVALVASSPQLLFVYPQLPANTAAEFIAYARANPDKLAYGSGGIGSINHLGMLLFLQANGLSALHVPYKGGAAPIADLIAGRIQFQMQSVSAVMAQVKDKRIKAVALAGLTRSPLLPDVPTLAETVMPGFEVAVWFGVMLPAKTPPAIVRRLNGEIVKALQDPAVKAPLEQQGAVIIASSPEEYGAYLRSELDRWSRIIKSSGLKLD